MNLSYVSFPVILEESCCPFVHTEGLNISSWSMFLAELKVHFLSKSMGSNMAIE